MITARQLSLIIAITVWGTMIGGVMYAHLVYFPPYLSHLPESNKLITGPYGIHDADFWMRVHPVAIVTSIAALLFNWKSGKRRKLILAALSLYLLALVATAIYFVPEHGFCSQQ